MNFPKAVSYSLKSSFDICPYMYYRQYISGEFYWIQSMDISSGNFYTSYGSLVHDVLKMAVQTEDLDINNYPDIVYEMVCIRLSKYSMNGDIETIFQDVMGDIENGFKFLISVDVLNVSHGVEQYFETEINVDYEDNGKDETHKQKIYGIIDLWYCQGDDIVIVDYKTGKSKSQRQVDEMDQLTFYTMLVKSNMDKFDWDIEGIIPKILYLRDNKLLTSRFRKEAEINKMLEDIMDILFTEDFTSGDPPAPYICKDCLGRYNCVVLNRQNKARQPKKKFKIY